jgi:hypothetical protein
MGSAEDNSEVRRGLDRSGTAARTMGVSLLSR